MEDMKKQSLEWKKCKKPRREPFRKRATYWHSKKVTEGEVLRAKGKDRGGWEKKRVIKWMFEVLSVSIQENGFCSKV